VHQIVALADEEVRRVMRSVSADVQASLALSRAMLQALAAVTPATGTACEQALESEIALARRLAAPQRVVDLIEEARSRLYDAPQDPADAGPMRALERALHAAAAALPDFEGFDDAPVFASAG
jgi:hypothetical protein